MRGMKDAMIAGLNVAAAFMLTIRLFAGWQGDPDDAVRGADFQNTIGRARFRGDG